MPRLGLAGQENTSPSKCRRFFRRGPSRAIGKGNMGVFFLSATAASLACSSSPVRCIVISVILPSS